MKTLNISFETADIIRAAAPRIGMTCTTEREIVGPEIEALHLTDEQFAKLDAFRKAKKVSIEKAIQRLVK